jgi:hypothetical protein
LRPPGRSRPPPTADATAPQAPVAELHEPDHPTVLDPVTRLETLLAAHGDDVVARQRDGPLDRVAQDRVTAAQGVEPARRTVGPAQRLPVGRQRIQLGGGVDDPQDLVDPPGVQRLEQVADEMLGRGVLHHGANLCRGGARGQPTASEAGDRRA